MNVVYKQELDTYCEGLTCQLFLQACETILGVHVQISVGVWICRLQYVAFSEAHKIQEFSADTLVSSPCITC